MRVVLNFVVIHIMGTQRLFSVKYVLLEDGSKFLGDCSNPAQFSKFTQQIPNDFLGLNFFHILLPSLVRGDNIT